MSRPPCDGDHAADGYHDGPPDHGSGLSDEHVGSGHISLAVTGARSYDLAAAALAFIALGLATCFATMRKPR